MVPSRGGGCLARAWRPPSMCSSKTPHVRQLFLPGAALRFPAMPRRMPSGRNSPARNGMPGPGWIGSSPDALLRRRTMHPSQRISPLRTASIVGPIDQASGRLAAEVLIVVPGTSVHLICENPQDSGFCPSRPSLAARRWWDVLFANAFNFRL